MASSLSFWLEFSINLLTILGFIFLVLRLLDSVLHQLSELVILIILDLCELNGALLIIKIKWNTESVVNTKDKNSAQKSWVDAHSATLVDSQWIDSNIRKNQTERQVKANDSGKEEVQIATAQDQASQNHALDQNQDLNFHQAISHQDLGQAVAEVKVAAIAGPLQKVTSGELVESILKKGAGHTTSVKMHIIELINIETLDIRIKKEILTTNIEQKRSGRP